MSLSYDEIESYLTKIFSGKEFVLVGDELLVMVFPSNEIKQRAELVYKKSYDDAISDGMLSSKDLESLVERRQLISVEEITKLKKLRSQLEAQEILLGKTTRVKANQERIKNIINRIRHDIKEIEFKKKSKLLFSAETKAEEEKSFYICCKCVYKDDGTLYWKSYEEAKKENRINLKDAILLSFLQFSHGTSNEIIRELARSNLWRIRYVNSMKTSDPLFGVPNSEYTMDQLNLVYWSNYYQNIYEMMPEDRPSDLVIDDDDALDAYMKSYYEERNREDAARKSKAKGAGKLSAFDAEEVIVTRSHELYQDIEYDTPREAQKLKDRIDLKKRTKRR
jgi:hypothetical protein